MVKILYHVKVPACFPQTGRASLEASLDKVIRGGGNSVFATPEGVSLDVYRVDLENTFVQVSPQYERSELQSVFSDALKAEGPVIVVTDLSVEVYLHPLPSAFD